LQLESEAEEAEGKANMYFILATVLVTVGIAGGFVPLISSSLLGLFGIVLVCLGIGCTAAAYRHEGKARSLKHALTRYD
jgi:cadmium resistance protein CadD (predicted permease)